MEYHQIAEAMLAEVGLTFDDVYDLGREWEYGPPGFRFVVGERMYRGICHMPNRNNPFTRQRHFIGITGPIDCEWMLHTLAHECGHVVTYRGGSTPEYEEEYKAERYAIDAFERLVGRPPHDFFITKGKRYVRMHCWRRFHQMGPDPAKGWRRDIVDWSEFPWQRLELVTR